MDTNKKIELLQKFIALANNNPNEHEANSAARRVCKLLVELKINFKIRGQEPPLRGKSPVQPNPYPKNPFNYADFMSDIFGSAWEDVFYTTKKEQQQSEFSEEQIKEAKRKMQEERDRELEKQRRAQEQFEREKRAQAEKNRQVYEEKFRRHQTNYGAPPFEVKIPPNFYPRNPFGTDIPHVGDELPKKERTCSECGKKVMTRYMGNLFVCYTCQYNEHNAKPK